MKIKYIVTETTFLSEKFKRTAYGIAASVIEDGIAVVLASVYDLTPSKDKALALANICNDRVLPPQRLKAVAEAFIIENY